MNRWFIIPQANSPDFFREYLGDILALPVYLPLSFYLALKLDIVSPDLELGIGHIVGAVLIFSVIFEGVVPLIDKSSTSDIWDILAYFGGGLIVYLVSRTGRTKVGSK
ncbi:MAG: hypothetical protein L3J79_06580 [Candidatus Marinimicrobia bacterium]|nr:hypothetical protein [Candidatus Neomarinimicrobiota bacterium]